jgi:uncharacterized protein (TIGR03083 family)
MTMTSPTSLDTTGPLDHHVAMDLFRAELQRTIDLWTLLDDDQWRRPTECPDWDVRQMGLHVLGACESGASLREFGHQMLAARRFQKRYGGPQEAALSATQVADRMGLTPSQLLDRMRGVAPRVVQRRRRTPALLRRVSVAIDGPVVERWTLGYLMDTIYLRDAWMHRVDVCRATGCEMVLTAEHDGLIVADVVREWAGRHGAALDLTLTGPAGGRFTHGRAGEVIEMDAVEFCRVLAGRGQGSGLLATIVPF